MQRHQQEPDADVQINEGKATFQEKYTEPLKLWYNDMIASGLYSQMALGLNSDQVIDMFANGEVAMMHGVHGILPRLNRRILR